MFCFKKPLKKYQFQIPPGTPNRALLTLPEELLEIVISQIEGAGLGVVARRFIAADVFGPYDGLID